MKRFCSTCNQLYEEVDLIKTTIIIENKDLPSPLQMVDYSCGNCLEGAANTVKTAYETYKMIGLINEG